MTLGLEKKNFSFFGKFNPFALNFQGRDLDLNSFFFLNYRPHGKKLSTFQVLSNKRPFFWRSCACAYNLLRIQYPLALPSFLLNRKDSLFFEGETMMVHGCERDICCVKAIYRETVYLSRQGRADFNLERKR